MCRKKLTYESTSELPFFPFCSERCRLIDLGKWADGSYRISTHLDRDREERATGEEETREARPPEEPEPE
jgi:endogenous inhibitor of DNA gyrase (YacG/DUF329 family)